MPDPTFGGASTGAAADPAPRFGEPSLSPRAGRAVTGGGAASSTPSTSTIDAATNALTGALEGRKNAAADAVRGFARTVHRSGEQFEGQQDWIASAVQRGAAELDDFADTLGRQSIGDLAGQVQTFAKRQPILFLSAAFAAGFGLARLGKIVAGDLSRDDLPTMAGVQSEASHGRP